VALADEGWTITTRTQFEERDPTRPAGATHGWEPELPSMGALIVAAGPAFAEGKVLPPIRTIELYALMTTILGLTPAPNSGRLHSVRTVPREGER
jgi:predicted AlkP superfamily pyrophosphatase or phosphodiesterase